MIPQVVFILNIETATKNCSVSLAKNGKTIALRETHEEGFSHAEQLHVFIVEVISEAQITLKDLTAIAVSQGPGSYTGLRIGVSAAKGLCYALNIPLIAIDTLQSLASQIKVTNALVIPMIDARRMEVFSACYDENLNVIQQVAAEIIDENSYDRQESVLHFLGDGAPKCQTFLKKSNFIFHNNNLYPSAKEMSSLSFLKHEKSDMVDVAYFEPLYVKDFQIIKKKIKE